ncbi:LOW QUALITY PROTEIN: uncharacterized protein ACR2FA_007473 [Aphomia sociella]
MGHIRHEFLALQYPEKYYRANDTICDKCRDAGHKGDECQQSSTAESVAQPNEVTIQSLDLEILELLGEDPQNHKLHGDSVHKDIATRWMHILINDLHKDTHSELVKRYLPPENFPNIRPPKLNLEVKAALPEINVKKDLYIVNKQTQLASGLAAIGQALSWALETKTTVPQNIIKSLGDAGRLICDSHYRESMSRRYAALNTLNKNIRDTIKNTKIDEYLFGSSLSEHIKSTKVISKTVSDMKPMPQRLPYKAPTVNFVQRDALNSRGARAAAVETRSNPVPRRPQRDRRQTAIRGRRSTGHTRQQTRKR